MQKDIFRKLTNGINFDFKKFENDASLFNLKSSSKNEENENLENNFEYLQKNNKLHVIGEDIPNPIQKFEDVIDMYKINEVFVNNLIKAKYLKPTPVQMQAIPLLMNKRELICCSYTGSGKTFAFLLPVAGYLDNLKRQDLKKNKKVNPYIKAVILAPTCELARQIHRECKWLTYGSQLTTCLINNVHKFENNEFDIFITTPKRLVYLLEKKSINLSKLEFLVIDECDRLFQHIFREQLSKIYNACSESPNICRSLFSATFDKKLEKWFQLNLDNVVTLLIGDKLNVPTNIKQELKYVGDKNGKFMAIKEIISQGIQPPVLIFCQYKSSANVLFAKMRQEKYNVRVIHSDIPEAKRSEIINNFRSGKILFLICTELMGRGIDFKGVVCLINYDYPPDPVTYIHRVGRTGRAGRQGRAITLFTYEEMEHPSKLRYIVTIMKQSNQEIPEYLKDLKSLMALPAVKKKKKFYDEKTQKPLKIKKIKLKKKNKVKKVEK